MILPVLLLFFFCGTSLADNNSPTLNSGDKWRIAYYQGGTIPFYANIQKELIKELMVLGWIQQSPLPKNGLNTEPPYWDWLCHTATSDYLEFLPTNGYSASWDLQKRKQQKASLLQKLKNKEIDLVIAMGTWAGEDLLNNLHSVPTLVFSSSNFLDTGLLESINDSGFDHVSVTLDPSFFERQLRMYHRLTQFQRLGVAYENTAEGLRYSSVNTIRRVAKEQNFSVNFCEVLDTTKDRETSRASCLSCFDKLSKNSDAIFITSLLCADEEIETISERFKKEKVKSYSVFGSKHAEKGILLTSSASNAYREHGKDSAHKIAKVLNGTLPRDLQQKLEIPLFLSINTTTAEAIGFTIPESIRRIAHDIYEK